MDLAKWLVGFKELHHRAHRGPLEGRDLAAYDAGREELARALVSAQRLPVRPGQSPRQALRVPRALQVDLESATRSERATTFDLSLSGFSVLLAKAPGADEAMKATLRLPGIPPVSTQVEVGEVKVQPGHARVTFHFRRLAEVDRHLLELAIFDAVLGQLSV